MKVPALSCVLLYVPARRFVVSVYTAFALELVGIEAHLLCKLVYALHLGRDVYALRAMLVTLSASYAVVCLPQFWDTAVVSYQICAAVLGIFWVFCATVWHDTLIDALVEVAEDGRDIQTVRTRHAVVALVAWYCLEIVYLVGDGHQQFVLLAGYGFER